MNTLHRTTASPNNSSFLMICSVRQTQHRYHEHSLLTSAHSLWYSVHTQTQHIYHEHSSLNNSSFFMKCSLYSNTTQISRTLFTKQQLILCDMQFTLKHNADITNTFHQTTTHSLWHAPEIQNNEYSRMARIQWFKQFLIKVSVRR